MLLAVQADLAVEGHVAVKGQVRKEAVDLQDVPPGSQKPQDAPLPQQGQGPPGALRDAAAGVGEQGSVYIKKDRLYHVTGSSLLYAVPVSIPQAGGEGKPFAGNIWRGAADRGVSGEYIEKFGKFL